MDENANSPEAHKAIPGLPRLASVAVLSVAIGFISIFIAVGIGGLGVLKPIPYVVPIAIAVGVITALVGFSLWPRSSSPMTLKEERPQ